MNKELDANKAVVTALMSAIETGSDISELLTADATWWVPEGCALSGSYKVTDLMAAMSQVFGLYKAPPKFKVEYITAEENRVAVFCSSSAELVDGSPVYNNYHYLFILENSLISEVKEFFNTALVGDIMARIGVLQAS